MYVRVRSCVRLHECRCKTRARMSVRMCFTYASVLACARLHACACKALAHYRVCVCFGVLACVRVHDCRSKARAQMCASKRRYCVRTHARMPMQARTLAHARTRTANTRTSRVLLARPRAAGLHTHINKRARAHTQTHTHTNTDRHTGESLCAHTRGRDAGYAAGNHTCARALMCSASR